MKAIAEPRRIAWTVLELAFAGLLIAWRFWTLIPHPLWLDIPLYLGLLWVFQAIFRDARAREGATLALALLFLGIYLNSVTQNLLYVADLLP